ncbi:DUF4124 domain-containing protein [Salinicola rhizosphaerae]|uniref:Penicillin-binding protein n=1 Tax=Salinicola rhizosphaerae TaxID=1443141 RepID=A0ABQ3EB44_9GAMM|nr:DUF4124 domain-containing protein [Salinicola rhizosphaerae]GHB32165.1 penicillin-binding protein [Salinicola rhizosphaerae]
MRKIKMSKILTRQVLAWPVLTSLALGSLTSLALAAPVYRHIDAQGNVVYSDEPQAGSRVDLAPITVVDPSAPHDADSVRSMTPAPSPEAAFEYARFAIASPGNEQTIPTGQAGNVQVKLSIEPALRRQDRVQLRVDGKVRQSPMHSSVFALSQLERGEHRLQAELVDGQGQTRLATPPVTIYVQRASVNLPRNPNNPNR